jgi:aconitate hydratase
MIIKPDAPGGAPAIEIYRGPNIGAPPANDPFPDAIKGEVTIKVGDKITTDHIVPAGTRMKYRSNIPKYSECFFEPLDGQCSERAAEIRDRGRHNIIIAGLSYGQGSSREHAAICTMFLGVKAVIAKSFERIHSANLINFGILPVIFKDEGDYERISQGDTLEIPDARKTIEENGRIIVRNVSNGVSFEVNYNLSERQKKILLAGGALNLRHI